MGINCRGYRIVGYGRKVMTAATVAMDIYKSWDQYPVCNLVWLFMSARVNRGDNSV
jgi:hypothetical protein